MNQDTTYVSHLSTRQMDPDPALKIKLKKKKNTKNLPPGDRTQELIS